MVNKSPSAIREVVRKRPFQVFLTLLLLFCAVAGARLILVERYAGSGPFWDQWDGEARHLYKPWVEGELSWSHWIAAHNEHRILLPRIQALALFIANQGQWDPIAQVTVNAFLAALCAVVFVLILYHGCGPALLKPGIWITLLLFAPPLAWENMFYGFQSQFFLQILFTLLAFWGAGLGKPFSLAWWTGIASLLLVVFTAGSGFFAGLSVAFLLAVTWWRCGRSVLSVGYWVTLGASCLTVVTGWLLRVEVPRHAPLKPASLGEFATAVWKNLAWPMDDFWWAACLLPLPAAILVLLHLRDGWRYRWRGLVPTGSNADGLLLVGSWCFLQMLAIAYSRGGGGLGPQGRHLDIHVLFLAMNAATMVLLVAKRRVGARGDVVPAPTPWALRLGAVWLLILASAVGEGLTDTFRARLPELARQGQAQVAHVRGYLATGDRETHLYDKARLDVPYPYPDKLADMLDDPVIRSFLPVVLQFQAPLQVDPYESDEEVFRYQDGLRPGMAPPPPDYPAFWGSYAPDPGVEGALRTEPFNVSKWGLRFLVGGYFGESSIDLRVVDDDSGQAVEVSGPPDRNRSAWRYVDAPVPGPTVYLEAVDARPHGWIAFTAPVEVGRLTSWLTRLEEAARWLFLLGAVPLFLLALRDLLRVWTEPGWGTPASISFTKESGGSPEKSSTKIN